MRSRIRTVRVVVAVGMLLAGCARQPGATGSDTSPSLAPCSQLIPGCRATRLQNVTLTDGLTSGALVGGWRGR